MNLSHIDHIIDPIILERGRAYRENGHILSINEIKPLIYYAEVVGSELYDVEIHLGLQDEVIYTLCECPFDQGPICKHAAAVLMEIRDEYFKKEKVQSTLKKEPTLKSNIADQLHKLSKDELIKLLVHFSNDIEQVEQALSLKFNNVDNEKGLNQYIKMIRSKVKQSSDRHGFVTYRNVRYAIAGAEKVMEKSEEALECGHYLRAAKISFCIIHEMGDLLQKCDDSDGYVGGLIEESLKIVQSAASEYEYNSYKDGPALFQLLLKEVLHPNLKGWNEWQLSLLESAIYLLTNDAQRDLWNNLIARLESQDENRSSYSTYFIEQAALLRYHVILKLEGDSQALKFLRDHLDITAFRDMAIEEAIKRQQFDKALELAQQGEQKDAIKGLPGLVDKWKKHRYDIYELTHQVESQAILAEEFALSGNYSYYLRFKELYSKNEWVAAYKSFLDKLESNCDRNGGAASLYPRVLIEEKETHRLLKYVQQHKRLLVDYYPHLLDGHAEEVFLLFGQVILEDAMRSTKRSEYRKVCGIIRHLMKAGGEVQARKLIEQLNHTYPHRVALKDELRMI